MRSAVAERRRRFVEFDPEHDDEALDDLVRQIQSLTHGTRYYVPRTR